MRNGCGGDLMPVTFTFALRLQVKADVQLQKYTHKKWMLYERKAQKKDVATAAAAVMEWITTSVMSLALPTNTRRKEMKKWKKEGPHVLTRESLNDLVPPASAFSASCVNFERGGATSRTIALALFYALTI